MEKWIAALPNTTEEQKTRQQTLAAECARVRSELDTKTGLGESGLVFSHCDLLSANCIIQPRTETADPNIEDINFIDYEYATPCPAAFDIANHFAEWIGFDCDYNRTPTRKTRRGFLEEYVKSFDQFQSLGSQEERGKVLDQLFDQVDQYRGMPGFYWYVSIDTISVPQRGKSESMLTNKQGRLVSNPSANLTNRLRLRFVRRVQTGRVLGLACGG